MTKHNTIVTSRQQLWYLSIKLVPPTPSVSLTVRVEYVIHLTRMVSPRQPEAASVANIASTTDAASPADIFSAAASATDICQHQLH